MLLKNSATGRLDNDSFYWDSQLVKYGNYVHRERVYLVSERTRSFRVFSMISSEKELVKLSYRSHLSEGDFSQALVTALNKDLF
jgi:recombinational DNA repair ATPase RecF